MILLLKLVDLLLAFIFGLLTLSVLILKANQIEETVMKYILILGLLIFSVYELKAQDEPKVLKGSTVMIHMFTCNRPQMITVDNTGDSLIVDLYSGSFNGSKKYFEGIIENNKILTKSLDIYLKQGYELISSLPNSDKCSYSYILYKKP